MGWCVLDDLCRSSVIFCPETKKATVDAAAFYGFDRVDALSDQGNWIYAGNSHQKFPFSLASNGTSVQDFSCIFLLPKAFILALCRARTDWTSRDCCRSSVKVGLNGETLQTAQRAAAHLSTITLAGRYEKTGLKRNRKPLERFESG